MTMLVVAMSGFMFLRGRFVQSVTTILIFTLPIMFKNTPSYGKVIVVSRSNELGILPPLYHFDQIYFFPININYSLLVMS